MSLFPAYSKETIPSDGVEEKPVTSTESQWLENNSFDIKQEQLANSQKENDDCDDLNSDTSSSICSPVSLLSLGGETRKRTLKKLKNKSKKKKRAHYDEDLRLDLEFTGEEEFYVDKGKAKQYISIITLHKPACPRYKKDFSKRLGENYTYKCVSEQKRYFSSNKLKENQVSQDICSLEENEYTSLMGALNRKTIESCQDLEPWLQLIKLQDRNPYKWSRLKVSEKKLDYIQKALNYIPRNIELYRLYIDIISTTYPSHDVTKMLDNLLNKDPYCYILWQAQIMTTQGTMARCTVPSVLELYQRCMRKMYAAQREERTASQVKDSVTIRLFHNCCLFLRQAGLYEHFFALIKLALELNVTSTENLCKELTPQPEDDATLIEYEELILQSGLPMNEIWLRIEKLRQSFNFLPVPGETQKCSDPQRIVFNEDVCHYVYPLKSKENSFRLILIIIKLLKIPFIGTHCLSDQFEGDSDAIEEILTFCLRHSYATPYLNSELTESIYELVKELCVSPTFLNHQIAHELYTQCLRSFLINTAATYDGVDERKRLALLLIWCRFERLLLTIETLSTKVTPDYIKSGQSRFKSMLKQKENRNSLYLYVEFAFYLVECKSARSAIENIFLNIINVHNNEEESVSAELCYVVVTYAEILIGWNELEKASQLLSCYGLGIQSGTETISDIRKLIALKSLHEKLEQTISMEANVNEMVLEQYLLPDSTISLLKAYTFLQFTLQQKQQALSHLDKLLSVFRKDSNNERHCFLREQIYELYTIVGQLPGGGDSRCLSKTIQKALKEYPHNVSLLYQWGTQPSIVWYKLRCGLLQLNPSIVSVMFLIALTRFRLMQLISTIPCIGDNTRAVADDLNIKHNEMMVRQRILNLFRDLLTQNSNTQSSTFSLQRNALLWRCYLRCLSDQSTSFETSHKCLLTALDECPWSKALYMDGVTYVPQELPHLQDLIIEKQLRIYALPEELEILREQ